MAREQINPIQLATVTLTAVGAEQTIPAIDLRPSMVHANDLTADRGNDTGAIYLGNSGTHYVYFNGTKFSITDGILLPAGDITKLVATKSATTDVWANTTIGAGTWSTGQTLVCSIDEATDFVFANINVQLQIAGNTAAGIAGWDFYIDGGLMRYGPKQILMVSPNNWAYVAWAATVMIAGPGSLAGTISAGSHTFEVRLTLGTSTGGIYARFGTGAPNERYQFEILELRK